MKPLVLTLSQLAEVLQCSEHTARGLVAGGVIRARRLGKTWRIPAAAVEAYLAGGDNVPEAQATASLPSVPTEQQEDDLNPGHPLVSHLRRNPGLLDMIEATPRPKGSRKRKTEDKQPG